MASVSLQPMTESEYAAWRPAAVASYADDHVRAGSMAAEDAQEKAEKQFSELLPDGLDTKGHHLLVAHFDQGSVGFLWVHIPDDSAQPAAFIYNIEVTDALRGQGLGRAIMVAGEEYVRDRGASSLRLHVFGENTVARHLYESLGYRTTNVLMSKSLDGNT